MECSSFPLVARAIKTHKAVAIVPRLAACEFTGDSFAMISDPLLKRFDRKIVLAWNTRMSRIRSIIEKARIAIAEEIKF